MPTPCPRCHSKNLTIFNHAQQLTPTPTLKDFGEMRKDNNFIALTEKEILERLPL